MKYEVRFSCGHTETVELFGKNADRQRKIAWFEESGLCSKCYAEQKAAEMAEGFDAVEMFYGDYKEKYSDCKTKPGSYNRETKTIIVYVPKEEPSEEREAKIIKAAAVENINTKIDAIRGAEYAADIINLFKGIRKSGDIMADAQSVMSVYRVSVPMSNGEKKILGK